MARLENVSWNSQAQRVNMKIRGAVSIPEAAFAMESPSIEVASPVPGLNLSSTESPCSSVSDLNATTLNHQPERFSMCSPRQLWPSHKYLAYGGPGFSIAAIDSVTGSSERIPVPMPTPTNMESVAYDDFSQAEVLSMTVVGESQIWAGTESGSLHVFDIALDLRSKQPELRFVKHMYTSLNDSVHCIVSQQLSIRSLSGESPDRLLRSSARVEVLLGSTHGNITIISGESDERGGLKNALKCPRKVVQLSNFEEESSQINCIAQVSCTGIETYWCGCGGDIVVLRRSDWKELVRLEGASGSPSRPGRKPTQIMQLLASECGVWSYTSSSSTISLWDTRDFAPKLHITCCNFCTVDGWVDDFAEIRALTYSYPLLFAGTNGGHLLVFKIMEGSNSPPSLGRSYSLPQDIAAVNTTQNSGSSNGSRKSQVEYRILAATHCGAQPIVGIYTSQLRDEMCRSPVGSLIGTPSASMQVLVVCGAPNRRNGDRDGLSSSQVQLYELSTSPLPSPVVSPAYLSTSRSVSVTSFGSISNRRGSISKTPQKLTLYSASPQSHILLPLAN